MAALHAVEQLANFEVRLAVTGANSAKKEDAKQHARDDLLRAIERLKGVLGLAKTGERYALLASAYKRLAALCETQVEVRSNLTLAAENYRHAHERALERKGFDPIRPSTGCRPLHCSARLPLTPRPFSRAAKPQRANATPRTGTSSRRWLFPMRHSSERSVVVSWPPEKRALEKSTPVLHTPL